jgi:hypothetical protein
MRQLAGNEVDRPADELLLRVETLQLPPHVALALEHLLERALPPSTSIARMKVSNF